MENYDINIDWGKAIVEVTIQCWNYKGHYRIQVEGNIKGTSILEDAFETSWLENKDVIWNDCKLNILENFDGDMIYSAELKDKDENILVIDETIEDLQKNIVGVQIVEYTEIEKD
jgi:hypothetical protein